MPRPKTQHQYALLPGTKAEDLQRRLQPEIEMLLAFANGGPEAFNAEVASLLSLSTDGQAVVNDVLTQLSEGRRQFQVSMPAWATEAFVNLCANVGSDDYHLRRCRLCGFWFVVYDRRRRLCNRDACLKASKKKQWADRKDAIAKGAVSRMRE